MDSTRALDQIAEIRLRMAGSLTFRGYRAGTTALTAGYAAIGAAVQASMLPLKHRFGGEVYIQIWATVALASIATVVVGWWLRRSTSGGPLDASLTLAAVEALVPSLVAGAMLTYAIGQFGPPSIAAICLLPGLWMILFSLGLFASRRLLPPAVFVAAGYYLLAGVATLTFEPRVALSHWTMGGVFVIGQLLSAAILYWTLERPEVRDAC
jgi:hypothetical protein